MVEIRGAGPVGCVLALALSRSGKSVVLVERGKPSPSFRPIALSHASRLILERVGAWQALAPTAIDEVHVSQQGAFGRTRLTAAEADVPALGYVIEYSDLHGVLRKELLNKEIPVVEAGDNPLLVVHAEGFAAAMAAQKDAARAAAILTARMAFAPSLLLFGVPSTSNILLSSAVWSAASMPISAGAINSLAFFTAVNVPLPK